MLVGGVPCLLQWGLLAGGWMLESTHYLGGAVIFLGVPLATVWAVYALYRVLALLGATWQAVRKN